MSCVREQESPCVLRIVALAVLPRRFPVLWFVHTWWLQSAAAAALTIGAAQVMSDPEEAWEKPLGRENSGMER